MANRFLESIPDEPAQNRFLKTQPESAEDSSEGWLSSISRTALQGPLGYIRRWTWPADVVKSLSSAIGEDELNRLKQEAENEGQEFDIEGARKGLEETSSYFPTQHLVEELVEQKTGLPLSPKNRLQSNIRLAGEAAGFRPGPASAKAVAAGTAPLVKEYAQFMGAPEGISDTLGLLASGITPRPSFAKKLKPSGLPERGFESLTKPTKVSPHRAEAVKEAVEKDFRGLAEDVLKKNETYSAMKNDVLFKEKVGDLFQEVEKLAENIPGSFPTQEIRLAIKERAAKVPSKGLSPSEYEVELAKQHRKQLSQITDANTTPKQLVEQYRKNNQSLRELFEPGKSSAANRAKKDALLGYNEAIKDLIAKKYPDSQFKNLFEASNKKWQDISDVEAIEQFTDKLFDGKINYGEAQKLFRHDKQHISRPFKRLLGDQGFQDFQQLTKDLLSTKNGMDLVKKAGEAGYGDLAATAGTYLLSPKLGGALTLKKFGKAAYQMLLDKPKLAITWKTALDDLKAGRYQSAQKGFSQIDQEAKAYEKTNPIVERAEAALQKNPQNTSAKLALEKAKRKR